ncbi:MAG: hypothetical protein GY801_11910 [bacterium]|nr:hypothetical protein [bacterium]
MKQVLIHCTVLLFYAVIACVLLTPLPAHLADGLLAAESGDPLLQSWVIQWNIHKLSTSLTEYFDANIFYPYPNTFAYHDHLFGLGLLGLPIYLISRNPLLTYNFLLLLSFVLSAYGMFLLCKDITQHIHAACLGGLIFGFSPFRFAHLDHLNLLSIYWLPLCFLFLTRYLVPRNRYARNGHLTLPFFWLCYFLQALTSFNYLFLSAIASGVYGIILALRQWRAGEYPWHAHIQRDLSVFFAGVCLVGLGFLPLVLPYLQANKSMGFERTIQETVALSARVQDYGIAPENNLLYGNVTKRWRSPISPYPREQILFPGVLTTLLAGVALIYGWKRSRNSACDSVRFALGSLLLVAFILSLGPFVSVFGKTFSLPYSWLYHALPGFKAMRVPARFGLLVAFSLSALASIGAMELYRHFGHGKKTRNRKRTQLIMTVLLGSVILLESFSPFSALSAYHGKVETLPEVYQWLRSQSAPLRIVELPIRSPKDNFEAMYYSTFHWKNMLNGRSAFIPNGIHRVFDELRSFPSQRTIALLKSLAIDYAIIHTQKLDFPPTTLFPEGLTLVHRFGDDWLIKIHHADERSSLSAASIRPIDIRLASSLQYGERYTMGVELESRSPRAFSPLPEEGSEVLVEWEKNGEPFYAATAKINHPVLFETEERHVVPLRFSTPDEPGDYLMRLEFQSVSIAPQKLSKHVTLLPELVDSRAPHKLQAEFLWTDIPEEWQQGRPLPIRMLVKNSGDTLWKAYIKDREFPEGEVRLAVVDWYEISSGDALIQQRGMKLGARGLLRYDIPPGQEVLLETEIPIPNIAGEFLLELDMLSEHVEWFSPEKTQTFTQKIRLK